MTASPTARAFARRLLRLGRFASLVEEHFVERASTLDTELAVRATGLTDSDRDDLCEWYSDDFLELVDELPTVLRFAVFTAADSALEGFLNAHCEAIADVTGSTVRLKDLTGKGIYRAQAFMKKVAGVAFPDAKPVWTDIQRLHELRNSVVHADGVVAPDKAKLRNWAPSMPGLRIREDGAVTLEAPFTRAALERYEDFAVAIDVCTDKFGLWGLDFATDPACPPTPGA